MIPFVPKTRTTEFKVKKAAAEVAEEVKKEEIRAFDKESSVFKPWKPDTEETVQQCAMFDFKYWKVPRICKDKQDLARVEELIQSNYSKLKHIFYSLIA